eukprot:2277073-Rhodomonas_salina.1
MGCRQRREKSGLGPGSYGGDWGGRGRRGRLRAWSGTWTVAVRHGQAVLRQHPLPFRKHANA